MAAGPVLDARALFAKESFWVNKDFDWFASQIPLLECPDPEITTTYYYRWELVTRHLVYGNPATGYVFSEFANRPFWSGAYGTISCPAGLQIDEVRWLRDPRFVRDYVRFWMTHPGAQPRHYSFWPAHAAWGAHLVHPEPDFTLGLLPALEANYRAWEISRWVDDMGLFWQLGHDDGMEFDINARQTPDIVRGGQSLRPSFNTYQWADARAISRMAGLRGDAPMAAAYAAKADRIKAALQTKLWDPERAFFFPMSNQRQERDGAVVEKHTLTYQSGKYAGSPHGRELHGYVPWAFGLPDAGFEEAWRFLGDEGFFKAPFGPTTVERNDPQFILQDGCCWWSGQSWPFATAQTLKAMANLLQGYQQSIVTRNDYGELLHTFAVTHRKDGRPYIAEAANPFTGSWKGHDMENRSEHYFHSNFADLIVTGLAGIQPAEGRALKIDPQIPEAWDYLALDQIPYQGQTLTVLWDRNGTRYSRGRGLTVLVNGAEAGKRPDLGPLTIALPEPRPEPEDKRPRMNFAVNNDGDYYPKFEVSGAGPGASVANLCDGSFVYDRRPANRWISGAGAAASETITVDFGTARTIDTVNAYVIDDGTIPGGVRAPAEIRLEAWIDGAWAPVANHTAPDGGKPCALAFEARSTPKLRLTLVNSEDGPSGLTEIEAWGPWQENYQPAPPPAGNLAWRAPDKPFPKATASHSDRFGGTPEKANDGRIVFAATPVNRWTSYGSPDKEDWLELDFGRPVIAGRVVLHLYDDGGGVQAPADYRIETWDGAAWQPRPILSKKPARPAGGMANEATFQPVSTSRLRVVFLHRNEARSGMTEIEVWKD